MIIGLAFDALHNCYAGPTEETRRSLSACRLLTGCILCSRLPLLGLNKKHE